jgi:cell division protein FtsZ
MITSGVRGIEFVALNTDLQALTRSRAPRRIILGERTTRGLGSGGNPAVGGKAGEESADAIAEVCEGADMVFVAAGMGGGTGTGASPVVARIAQESGALTVGVVTRPFTFEGSRRRWAADEGLEALRDRLHTLIIIPNDRVLQVIDRRTTVESAFSTIDDVLRQGIQGISELITRPGLINLDFADVKSVMYESGIALMAVGTASGDERAVEAAEEAMASPLLDLSMHGARGVLFNITGGVDLTLSEINRAADVVRAAADPDANIIFGAVIDEQMEGEVRITVIATGFQPGTTRSAGERFLANARLRSEPSEREQPERRPLPVEDEPEPPAAVRPSTPRLTDPDRPRSSSDWRRGE